MNPSNPLLNRLYEKKTSKNKRQPVVIKDELSNRDKVLIPKLATKNVIQLGANSVADRQKTSIIKPNLAKLPPLSQKQIGKQPPMPVQKKIKFRQRKVSFNTTRDIPLFPTQFTFSTPQLEQKEQEQEIFQKKQSTQKFKTFKSEPVIQKNQQQLFEYLKILEKNDELKQQFCYMNRGELPYSYEIVQYEDVNKNQFLTVSLRGVSIYKDGQSQFTTGEKLYREIQLYRKIKKIEFFQSYILLKTLKHWRYRSVRRRFEGQCKLIGKILLSQNQILQNYHHFLFNLKEDFIKCKFMDLRISSTGNLSTLQNELRNKEETIEKSIDYFESTIQKTLKQTIEKNLNRFRKQERVSLTSDGKQVGDQPFLPFDSKKKSMKYTQIAKLKQFEISMFRLLKMTDLIRFDTKAEMVKDGLINYAAQMKNLHDKYVNRKSASFVSWINMKITIGKSNKTPNSALICTPSLQQIQQMLRNHLKSILDKFYKKHYLLTQKKDDYFCQSYQPQSQQFPTKLQFKYFIETNSSYLNLKNDCEQKLQLCLNDIKEQLKNAEDLLLRIYDQSFVNKDIGDYMENQALKEYLVSQSKSRQLMAQSEQIIEFGLVYLDMSEAFVTAREKFEEKFKYISNAIPVEVAKRCEALAQKIKSIYNLFKQNPSTVMQFITSTKNYHEKKKQMPDLQKKIQGILELEDMVYRNGLRIGENSKMFINQSSTYFRELEKRFEEIEGNQEKERKKFYKVIDDMVEPLNQRAEELYNKIYEDQLISNSGSDITKCMEKLTSYEYQFSKIKEKKEQIFYYQNELKIGNKDIPNYFKLQSNLEWIIKIWNGRLKYNQFLQHVNTKGYAQKSNLNMSDLKLFIRDIELATSQIEYVQLLQNFKQDALRVLSILQICKMLSAQTLQEEHKNTIRSKLVTKNKRIKDYLFLIEGGRTIICNDLINETNILEIRQDLEEVVHASAQESIIKKNILEVEQFWKKSKIIIVSSDISKNGLQIQHFGTLQNQKLQQKIGSYLLTFKNILGSKHSVGDLHNRITQQIQICQYLKTLIQKWIQVEKQWIKLLPLMTNCPSVKHQSNVYFQFTSLDNSIRKHNRQINDQSSLRKIVEDYGEKRYLGLMENIERDLREVNKTFASFLEIKRNTYHRFFFLADQELINILENTKDAKSLAKYAGYCFNCDRLVLERELVSGFQTPTEMFKLRKGILKGQPDEMFKSVEQNMKTSLKFSIMTLIPKMKVGMNIEQEHQNCLQAVLVADRFLWTQMTQLYLNPTSYESYELFLRRPCQQLLKYIRKTDITPQQRHKLSVRLVQAMGLRQTGQQMIKLQITKQDFKWKQQRKYTIEQQQIMITQFNRKFVYGLEYYPPSKITVPTENYRMLLNQVYETSLSEKVLVVTGVEGDGKRNLMQSCAREYGYFYKELVCNKNISSQYILRFLQGAVLAGAWLSFYEFQHLESKVLVKVLNQIKKIVAKIKRNQQGQPIENSLGLSGNLNLQRISSGMSPTLKVPSPNFPGPSSQKTLIRTSNGVMFNFITHGFYPEKVSVYQFDTFALSEPNHKKICEWLLQVNNFTEWEHLSARLVAFLETVFPFLQRVMGSLMSILRKVIDTACNKKKHYSHKRKQTQILAETFKQEILEKSDENIHHILNQALHTYFFYQIPHEFQVTQHTQSKKLKRRKSLSIDSKLNVLCTLINKKVKNILVIGPRTNKSRLIKQVGLALNRQILSIYPQSCQYFFHDETIQKLNKLDQKQIIHYDGQSIVREWNDLVISGYLLMEGKKIHLNNQLVIELREVGNCSPSFVGSCQIVYIGHVMNKKERFVMLSSAGSCQLIMEPLCQIFGELLENMPENLVEIFATFLKQYAREPRSKNFHKLICWFASILGIQGIWNRYYGGRYIDFTVSKYFQQLVPIDESKYQAIQQKTYNEGISKGIFTMGNLLIHTKSTILYYELYRNLIQLSVPVMLTGKFDTGKSTLLKLLLSNLSFLAQTPTTPPSPTKPQSLSQSPLSPLSSSSPVSPSISPIPQPQPHQIPSSQTSTQLTKILLPIVSKTQDWTKVIKSSLTNIRRDGKNYLMNVGDNQIIVAVDDLDLGYQSHREYLRQLVDLRTLYDGRLEEYAVEKVRIVGVWHKQHLTDPNPKSQSTPPTPKLFSRTTQLPLPQFTKQSLTTILRTNIDHFTKKNNMSKQVISVIDTYLIKSLLIAFDDIANISGWGAAASVVLATMRNLLALPRRNVLMGVEGFVGYFRAQLRVRMFEKCFSAKAVWQYNNVFQNLNKIIFNNLLPKPTNPQQQPILLFQQHKFSPILPQKLTQKLTQSFPSLYIFPQMLKIIILLNNQLHLLDSNCILVGRSGTGKVSILKVVAQMNKMYVFDNKYDVSQAVVRCLRGDCVLLLERYLRRDFGRLVAGGLGRTWYQRVRDCASDTELEKLVTDQNMKKEYRILAAEIPNREGQDNSTKVLQRVLSRLRSVLIFDTLAKYKEAVNRIRELSRYFVCYIDEWPAEALLNISGINVPQISTQPAQQQDPKKPKQPQSNIDLPKLLAQVFTSTNRTMLSYDQPSISIKKFKFYLSIYETLYKIRHQELTEKVEFYTKIYSKFNDASNLIAEWERRVDVLRVELEESIKKLDEELQGNQVESVTFGLLYGLRQKEEDKILVKNQEMAGIKKMMELQLHGMKKTMDKISKIVGSMQRTEMSELKKIYKSSQLVGFGLQCLCLLLGQQPSQKSINKILADPNLMMKMKSQSILQTTNPRVIQKFKKEQSGIKQQYDNKSKLEASRVLVDWMKSVIQYWGILAEHQQLNGTYKAHRKDYEESLEKQREIQGSIGELKARMMKLSDHYTQLFNKKEENILEYSKISVKIRNAKQLLPALKKSEEQTWLVVKQLRSNLSSLVGNTILASVCLVYLPLKRLKLKKQVIEEIKKLLNIRMVQFSTDFMSLISRIQDALLQDLNLVAIKQLEEFPVLIVDPERRAMNYLFDHDPQLAASIVSNTFSAEIANSLDFQAQIKKHTKQPQQPKQPQLQQIQMQESQVIHPDPTDPTHKQQQPKYSRKNPIMHTTQQNYRPILQKLPEQTFIVDWKFTTINTNQKIFLRIAAKKKPEYFQARKELNWKIKRDLKKIQQYKREIYQTICQKQIKILDDQQFVDLGSKLLALQVQTETNKKTEQQKIQQIAEYAKQINEQVTKVVYMVNSLKKIKNVALDLILDVACSDTNTLENIVRWVLAILEPKQRLGWLLCVLLDFLGEGNQELLAVLVKDTPLKIGEMTRNKKPISISNKNYENICKLANYSANLKAFGDIVLRFAKEFQTWVLDPMSEQIPSMFKPENLTILEELVLLKLFKPKILLSRIKKHIKSSLKLPKIQPYTNQQLLQKTNKKFPILSNCSIDHLHHLCAQLNNSKIHLKSLVQITDALELKKFIWAQMNEGNWVVLHSIYDRNAREVLEDIVEYVVNYQEQECFRLFVYVDQVDLGGYQSMYQVTTKYNNVSAQASNNRRRLTTLQREIVDESKYLENIGVSIYEELPSFKSILLQAIEEFNIQIPQVNVQMAVQNPSTSSFLIPQTPSSRITTSTPAQKPTMPTFLSTLIPNILSSTISMAASQKQKFYFQKLLIYLSISQVAAWMKFPKTRLIKMHNKLLSLAKYIKQYSVPMEFNLYTIAAYVGRCYSSGLDTAERRDVQELMDRIFDQTKINDKQLYGVPIHKQSIALAFAGIGRGGIEIDKNWVDEKVRNNYQLLGCEESYLAQKNAEQVQSIFNILAQIRFSTKSAKDQVPQIRLALSRLPTTPISQSRQTKTQIFLHSYQTQQKCHNKNLASAKQFLQWINIASNQDIKEDEEGAPDGTGLSTFDVFNWDNLLRKVRELTGGDVLGHRVRVGLNAWVQNVKRKHQFLLYWNMDNPVLVLHPVILSNFPMLVSSYIINYLTTNYTKIKQQGQSTNQNILYSLQIEFSRQTDQKELYMAQGILLPDLLYKEFRFNFQLKMLDGLVEWNGEEPAPLVMLKMKRVPSNVDSNGKEKDNQGYQSPSIQIGTRVQNKVEVVYKIDTYIDGNFQQWGLRRPMLISE